MDSLSTANYSDQSARVLVGSYNDPVFGLTQAQAIMQYRIDDLNTKIPSSAIFDSVILKMRVDFYCYGTGGSSSQTLGVYELADTLSSRRDYFFNTITPISPTPLGSTSHMVNRVFYTQEFNDTDKDSTITVDVKLSNDFGKRLFSAIDPEDINFTDYDKFKVAFKGLAIVPTQSDKIIGLKPFDIIREGIVPTSFLTLYYHDGADKKTVSFTFLRVTYSRIFSDRSASELSGLTKFHTDFDPGLKCYIQSGTSVITKLDFSKFYEYTDTIPTMIINSAELEISNVETSDEFTIPKNLAISMLKPNNRYGSHSRNDTTEYITFNQTITLADQFIATDDRQLFTLNYTATPNTYNGFPTFFFQRLSELREKKYPYWALRSVNPSPGKSVDRLVFPKDKIKLKIYYTQPILENQ